MEKLALRIASILARYAVSIPSSRMNEQTPPPLQAGDTAWLLTSAALVLLMVFGLSLFYGGMVRRKNVLSTFMHSFVALPVISLLWFFVGHSLVFGKTHGGLIGGTEFFAFRSLYGSNNQTTPSLAFASYQMMFAAITPALISGAIAERIRFTTYVVYITLWSLLVYVPVAHWVWGTGGWLSELHALDFAGGAVIHVTAGSAALVAALMVGKRLKYPQERPTPHNLTMTLLGAGILWFGWFGFNAGSALKASPLAALAFANTHLAACGGALAWLVVEWKHRGKPTALGVASGLVAGLVGITPAAGFVAPWAAPIIGGVTSALCYAAVVKKDRFGYDDSLDAFGVHGVGGFVGALLTGVFAEVRMNEAGADGLLFGNFKLVGIQLLTCLVAAVYSGGMTWVLLKVLALRMELRVAPNDEREGLDTTQHGESAYNG